MSALDQFRDHCRKMATAEHKPECPSLAEPRWEDFDPAAKYPHGTQRWTAMNLVKIPPSTCDGCLTDHDRALFARLADEVDAYLAPQVDLFGEVTVEPETAPRESA